MLLPSLKLSNGFSLQLKSNLHFLLWLTKHYMIWLLPIFLSHLFHAPVCSSHTGHLALPSHPPINLLFPLPKTLFSLLRIAAFIIPEVSNITSERLSLTNVFKTAPYLLTRHSAYPYSVSFLSYICLLVILCVLH